MKALTKSIKLQLKSACDYGKNLYMVNPVDSSLIRIIDVKTKSGFTAVRSLVPDTWGMVFEKDKFIIQ